MTPDSDAESLNSSERIRRIIRDVRALAIPALVVIVAAVLLAPVRESDGTTKHSVLQAIGILVYVLIAWGAAELLL